MKNKKAKRNFNLYERSYSNSKAIKFNFNKSNLTSQKNINRKEIK